MDTSRRPSLRRALASLLTGALIAAGAIVGFAAPAQAADARSLSATTTAVAHSKVTVAVSGSGFTDIPILIGQQVPSFYVAFIKKGTPLDGISQGGATVVTPVYPTTDGAVTGSLEQTAANLDRTASYEIIAWPSRSNPSDSNLYARADVSIDWNALFPATATTTTLSASPFGTAQFGDTVALSASVSPFAAGSVEFFDGAVSLGVSAVNDAGVAQVSTGALAEGARSLTATFTPTDAATFAGSTSAALPYAITAVPVVPAAPAVQVFLADGVTAYTGQPVYTDDQLVVKGTGFDPTSNVGGRGAPIPNTLPQGTYVVFGSFKDVWKPSLGTATAPASARVTTDTKWALAESVLNQVPPLYQATVRGQWTALSSTGAFETTLTAKDFARGLSDGTWGVYTYGAGGVANAAQELAVKVNYLGTAVEPEVPGKPTVTVTPNASLDPTVKNVITVSGTGFTGPGAANGTYVLLGETSVWSGGSALPSDGWLVQGWVPTIVDGAFTTTLSVAAGTLDPKKTYHVATSAAHGLSVTDRTLDTFTPVSVLQLAETGPSIYLSAPSVVQGGGLTVRGGGFTQGTPVTVTVNSDPFTLGSTTVGADGTFSVSGVIPATFAPGVHTVRAVAGDVTVEESITIAAAPVVEQPAVATCTAQAVAGASLTWNVKQSFRDYIGGPIAKGSYSINWTSGSGAYNTTDNRGRVSFGGSASFSGHSGLLDLTISNPRIQVYSTGSAALIANIVSKGYGDSPAVNASGVVIANLALPAATVSGNTIRWNGASATLTAAGASAFGGFYSAGDALDPVSFSFPLGAEVPCDTTTSNELAATGGTTPDATLWLGLSMLVLGAGLVVLRRRRALV